MSKSARDVVDECARACATCPHALLLRDIKRISRTTSRGGLTPADCSWLICDRWNFLTTTETRARFMRSSGDVQPVCVHSPKMVTGAAKVGDPGLGASL